MKVLFSPQIFEKQSNTEFHENPSSGNGVVPCGRTDTTKLNSRFSQFCERAQKGNECATTVTPCRLLCTVTKDFQTQSTKKPNQDIQHIGRCRVMLQGDEHLTSRYFCQRRDCHFGNTSFPYCAGSCGSFLKQSRRKQGEKKQKSCFCFFQVPVLISLYVECKRPKLPHDEVRF